MARIPRHFIKTEPGLYKFNEFTIKKDGITRQDGSVIATYLATNERGEIVATRPTAQELYLFLESISQPESEK